MRFHFPFDRVGDERIFRDDRLGQSGNANSKVSLGLHYVVDKDWIKILLRFIEGRELRAKYGVWLQRGVESWQTKETWRSAFANEPFIFGLKKGNPKAGKKNTGNKPRHR